MTDPFDQFPEPPSAREAPAIIRLPPPPPIPEPYQPRSGSENRKRRHVKRCRFDDAELAEFERRARARNLSDGAFIRASTLDTPGPRAQRNHRPPPEMRLLVRHLSEFNRIGNNLNQTARALNELRLAAHEMEADRLMHIVGLLDERNQTAIEELRAAVAALIRTLDDCEG